MTREEEIERLKILMGEDEEVAKAENPNIEAPKTNTIPERDAEIIYLQRLMEDTSESAYDRAQKGADKAYTDYGLETNDRKKLATYQRIFQEEEARAMSNGDTESVYKNRILQNKVKDQMEQNKNLFSWAEDWFDSITQYAGKGASDIASSMNRIGQNMTVNLDANLLYDIASSEESIVDILKKYNSGNPVDFYKAYNIANLIDARDKNSQDEDIALLYDLVMNQRFKGGSEEDTTNKNTIKGLAGYANEVERERRYKTSGTYEHNQGLQQSLENLEIRKQDTWNGLQNAVLSGVGVASYMIPSITAGVATAGVGEAVAGGAGLALSEEALGALSQAGSLGSMYLSSSGSAFNQTLNEGYNWNKANAYAILIGGLETVTELIGGENVMAGLAGFATHTVTSKGAQALISKGKNWLSKLLIATALDIGAEATEEMLSAVIEPIINKEVLGKDTSAKEYWTGILESARDSVIPTIIMGGFGKARTINAVKGWQKYLDAKLNLMESEGSISEQEYKDMKAELKLWSDDAIAGIDEHYEEIVNKLEDGTELGKVTYNKTYGDAIREIDEFTTQRMNGTQEVLKYAQEIDKLQDLTPEQKQTQINQLAKSYNINEQQLQEIFRDYKEVLPQSYQEGQKRIETPSAQLTAQTAINNQVAKTSLGKVLDITSKTPTAKFNALKGIIKGEVETANGIERINVENTQDMYDYTVETERNRDRNREVKPDELYNSPVAFTVYGKDGKTTTYIYKNMSDWQKDMKVTYGGLNQVVGKGKDKMRYAVQSVSGLGEYYAKRNSLYKGGWEWYNANGERVYGGDFRKHRKTSVDSNTKNDKISAEVGEVDNDVGRKSQKSDGNKQNIAEKRSESKPSRANDRDSLGRYRTNTNNNKQAESNEQRTNRQDVDFAIRRFGLRRSSQNSLGKELTKEQISYFKDSTAVDKKGRLLVLYHGSPNIFKVFDKSKIGMQHGTNGGDGFHFALDKNYAKSNGEHLYEVYLNIKNPFIVADNPQTDIWELKREARQKGMEFIDYMESLGYDGIKTSENFWIAFEPNQIKVTSNLNPTNSDNMYDDEQNSKKGSFSLQENFNKEYAKEQKSNPFNKKKAEETQESTDKYITKSSEEIKNKPIVRDIEARNRGEVKRETPKQKSSRFRMIRIANEYLGGRLAKLKGPATRTALGTHNPKDNWVRLGKSTDVDTLFHEVGHFMNSVVFPNAFDNEEVNKEFRKICDEAFGNYYKNKKKQQLKEGFAEAVRRYVDDREILTATYPKIVDFFDKLRNQSPEGKVAFELLDRLSEEVRNYVNMESEDRFRAMFRRHPDDPSGKASADIDGLWRQLGTQLFKRVFNREVYANKYDRWNAKAKNAKYRDVLSIDKVEDSIRLNGNKARIAFQILHGIRDAKNFGRKITHGFDEIIDALKPSKEEVEASGLSEEALWQRNIEDAMVYGLTLRLITLYKSSRVYNDMGVLPTDLVTTYDKFKDNKKINDAVNMINENSKAILKYAYEQGILTEKQYKQMLKDNPFYFPLNRVQADEDFGRKTFGYHSTGKVFYQLKGSDELIENPLISLASNWGTILRKIEENNTMKQLVKSAEGVKGSGIWFTTDVPPEVKKIATARLEDFKNNLESQLDQIGYEMWQSYGADDQLTGKDFLEMMDLDATADLFAPLTENLGNRVLSYYDGGKRKYIQFANNDYGKGLFDIFANMNTETQSMFLDILAGINAPLKLGATAWNVEFALSNMQSDAIQRLMYGSGSFLGRMYIPIITNAINVARYLKDRGGEKFFKRPSSEVYDKYIQSGADQSGKFTSNRANLLYGTEEMFGKTKKQLFGKPTNDFIDKREEAKTKIRRAIEKLSNVATSSKIAKVANALPEISEQATRYAEFVSVYNQMIKKGYDEDVAIREAGMKARQVTQDFTVQGTLMREINKIVPFASATVGGLYRFGQEVRNNPLQLGRRLSGLGAIALLASLAMHGDDRDWYDELNDQKKFDNFFFPNFFNSEDKRHPIIIKKPQGPLRYWVNFVQLVFDAEMGYIPEDKLVDRFYDWLCKSMKDASPISDITDLTPGALQAFLENRVNQDFFYGTPIVSKDIEKLDPRNQYDEYTSEIAKAIGNVFNYSPAKIDNVLKKWFAGLGKQFLNATDDIIRTAQGEQMPDKDISEQFLLSKLFGNALRSSASVNEVYDRIEYLEREDAEGRLDFEGQQELEKLKTATKTMSKYNKQIKAIRNDDNLSSSEKKAKMDELYLLRTDTARNALGLKLLDSTDKESIELMKYYPANDTYTYKKKEVSFADEKTQKEYAEMFKNKYEKEIEKLKKQFKYKHATDEEKAKMEDTVWQSARNETTSKMKKIVANRNK